MPIIIVHVVLNSKTVFEQEGLPVNEDMNIEEFFKDVVVYKLKPELWEKILLVTQKQVKWKKQDWNAILGKLLNSVENM